MSSTGAVVSLAGLQHFTIFIKLPPEIRFMIWQLSLSPRIVEVFVSDNCTGFYSQAALPAALHVCRESREAVEARYPSCFGSFLQPEKVRFNFDIDVLYLDSTEEEEGLYHFLGILKENELTRLKYVAIDELYIHGGIPDYDFRKAGLKRALQAMTSVKEMIVVRDITDDDLHRGNPFQPARQMKFYAELRTGGAEEGWPADIEELPEVHEYSAWSNGLKMTPVYGWRGDILSESSRG